MTLPASLRRCGLLLRAAAVAMLLWGATAPAGLAAGRATPDGTVSRDRRTGVVTREEPRRARASVRRTRPSTTDRGDARSRSPSKIFGADDRWYVADTEAFPWRCACKVFADFPTGPTMIGSGVMVGRSHMLTAAHVVYDADLGGWADLTVIPGYDDGYEPYGRFADVTSTTFTGWTDNGDFAYDMALVELDAPAGDSTGWLGMWAAPASPLRKKKLTTSGFPGDVADGEAMVAARGKLNAVGAETLYYKRTLDMMPGQSGSGMWVRKGSSTYVVGVISWYDDSTNASVRLSGWKFDRIVEWMEE